MMEGHKISLERQWILDRLETLSVKEQAQLEQQGYLLNTAETGYIRHERTEAQPEFGMTM